MIDTFQESIYIFAKVFFRFHCSWTEKILTYQLGEVCLFFYDDWRLDLLGRRHWETFKPSNVFSSMHTSLLTYRDKREKRASHIVFNSMRTSMKLSRTYNFPTNNSFIQFVRDECSSISDDKRSQDDFQAEKGFHLNNKLQTLFLGKWPEIYSVIMTNRR